MAELPLIFTELCKCECQVGGAKEKSSKITIRHKQDFTDAITAEQASNIGLQMHLYRKNKKAGRSPPFGIS